MLILKPRAFRFIVCVVVLLSVSIVSSCSDHSANKPAVEVITFKGICDGSAAALVSDNRLLIAYDERNALYLYPTTGGNAIAEFPYQKFLGIDKDEVDVEAVAATDNGLWWIGSHGLDGDGEHAPNRQILFKTNAPSTADESLHVLEVETELMNAILDSTEVRRFIGKKVLRKKPKKGGFNIEGLAIANDGSLLLGIRSPLTAEDQAIVIQLTLNDSKFTVKGIHELDLGERGIRDIHPVKNGFYVIAGDVGGGGVFAIYKWTLGQKAKVLAHIDRRLNAEALVSVGDYWLVLSDDGKVERGSGGRCDTIAGDTLSLNKGVYFRALKMTNKALVGN